MGLQMGKLWPHAALGAGRNRWTETILDSPPGSQARSRQIVADRARGKLPAPSGWLGLPKLPVLRATDLQPRETRAYLRARTLLIPMRSRCVTAVAPDGRSAPSARVSPGVHPTVHLSVSHHACVCHAPPTPRSTRPLQPSGDTQPSTSQSHSLSAPRTAIDNLRRGCRLSSDSPSAPPCHLHTQVHLQSAAVARPCISSLHRMIRPHCQLHAILVLTKLRPLPPSARRPSLLRARTPKHV